MSTFLRLFSEFRTLERRAELTDISLDEAREKQRQAEHNNSLNSLRLEELGLKLEVEQSLHIKATDEVRLWRSRADYAETDRDKLRVELTNALKAASNWQALMTGAPHVMFPEVYTPPPAPPLSPEGERQSPRPMTLRDMQRSAIMKSRMEAAERFKTHSASGE